MELRGVAVSFVLQELPKRCLHPDEGFTAVVRGEGNDDLAIGGPSMGSGRDASIQTALLKVKIRRPSRVCRQLSQIP